MISLSGKLVNHVERIKYNEIPTDVIHKAKLCILHTLACSFIGYKLKWSRAAAELAKDFGRTGGASVWFYNQKADPVEAAFVNSVMAQSIFHEDIHWESNTHPGIIVIPTALAMAEHFNVSGKKLIHAIITGYEMMGRLGRTISDEFGRRGFRPTSIIGTIASSTAAGKILDLNEEQQLNAIGLAGNFTSGVNEWAYAGTDDLYFQNGTAARNGIIAATLAQKGINASKTIIEGKAGLSNAYGLSEKSLDHLSDNSYEIMKVMFKPVPACALVQTTAQTALDVARSRIVPNNIEKVIIKTFSLGKNYPGCDYAGPFERITQARMSNQYNFAAILIKGSISDEVYKNYVDEEINAFAQKIEVVIDSEIDKRFPQYQPVEIELYMKDGKKYHFKKDEPDYLNREDLINNLFTHCGPVLGDEVVQKIIETVQNLENTENIHQLTELLKIPS